MKFIIHHFFATICLAVLLLSCQEKKPQLKLVDEPEDSLQILADSLELTFEHPQNLSYPITAGAESQRSIWLGVLSSCYASNLLSKQLVNTNLLFLGASSNMYLGTIVDKRLLNNDFDVKTDLKHIIPAEDFKKFSNIGESVNNCDLTKTKNTDFGLDLFLGGVVSSGMNDSLGLNLAKWDSIAFVSGSWQIDYIRESDFLRYLDTSKNENVKYYKDIAFNNRNRIITKVVKVTGFSANAFYKGNVAASIDMNLTKPITVNVTNNSNEATNDSNHMTGKLTFSKQTSKQVTISSSSSFYIFGNVKKATKF